MNIVIYRGTFTRGNIEHSGLICCCQAEPRDFTEVTGIKDGFVKKMKENIDSRNHKKEMVVIVPFALFDIKAHRPTYENASELFRLLKLELKHFTFVPFNEKKIGSSFEMVGGEDAFQTGVKFNQNLCSTHIEYCFFIYDKRV